ncbi:hypothetical protein [Nocardia sp. alder85J]|uniref:hypothetical protein n=1 Tax=Nocardia sp. alder85J TaxID=2862949 RepID=UPI001CD4F4C4|nr:hypothetical protein [Nocardia sp. alder85J]MCX4097820.1 hypothetical protein [Nocardia sp. alder85J]
MTADLPDLPEAPHGSAPAAEESEGGAEQTVAGGPVGASDRTGSVSGSASADAESSESVVRHPPQPVAAAVDAPVADAEPAPVAGARLRSVLTAVLAVWLLAAVVAAGWFGFGWVRAAYFTDAPRAEARDSVLDSARQAAVNLSSMNPNDVDGSIDLMRSSMTGAMLDQLTQNRDRIKQAAEQSKTKIEAKVLGASLSALNSERNKATALVVLQLTQTAPSVPVQSFRTTWSLDMTRGGDGWKTEQANSLGQLVPLDTPGPAQPAPTAVPAPPASPQAPEPKPGS